MTLNAKVKDAAHRIADELAATEIKLVASLPDDWIAELIKTLEGDSAFHSRAGQPRRIRCRSLLRMFFQQHALRWRSWGLLA